MYTSSVPCGNAALKRFTKITRETFDSSLGADHWPVKVHEPMASHSLKLGQFALLVKKDYTAAMNVNHDNSPNSSNNDNILEKHTKKHQKKIWPYKISDDWCPPGTTLPYWKGSLHTCSDKICKWNCVGLQGAYLACFLHQPVYITTLTVGRKLSECVCRRAVCCRAHEFRFEFSSYVDERNHEMKNKVRKLDQCNDGTDQKNTVGFVAKQIFSLHHLTIMETRVYMDESGVLDMSGCKTVGGDVRFNSSLCWVWWAAATNESSIGSCTKTMAECIDGNNGFVCSYWSYSDSDMKAAAHHDNEIFSSRKEMKVSLVSTQSLLSLHRYVIRLLDDTVPPESKLSSGPKTLSEITQWKRKVSPSYELAKEQLLTKHRVFHDWCRRI